MNKEIVSLLYRSFDEELSAEENDRLQAALAVSRELQEEKRQILEMRRTLAESVQKKFQASFADQVMESVYALTEKSRGGESIFDAFFNAFRPIAIAASLVILIFVAINIFTTDDVSIGGAFAVSDADATVEEAYEPSITLTLE